MVGFVASPYLVNKKDTAITCTYEATGFYNFDAIFLYRK